MRVQSTGISRKSISFRQAIFEGLAPDGGLYLPTVTRPFDQAELEALVGQPFADVALAVARRFLEDEVAPDTLEDIVRGALDFPVPLSSLGDGDSFFLELFHGPTRAFKDVGARFLARAMSILDPHPRRLKTVLVATSGDTGGAVANAFQNLPSTEVVVLFPHGQVSDFQRRQFTTLGGNVRAVAVHGTFDDCQRLAKEAFRDQTLSDAEGLTSANSINVGRLLPQIFFHVYAWTALPSDARRRSITLSIPSGNYGNMTAAVFAKRLGVPIQRFIAATNANDVVPKYLQTGDYLPRPSTRTVSSAMDVGSPSNFDRLSHLFGMRVEAMRAEIMGSSHTDAETLEAISDLNKRHGRLVDPHTAVGWLGWSAHRRPNEVGIVASTAHPMKFQNTIRRALGQPPASEASKSTDPESWIDLEYPQMSLLRSRLDWHQ